MNKQDCTVKMQVLNHLPNLSEEEPNLKRPPLPALATGPLGLTQGWFTPGNLELSA